MRLTQLHALHQASSHLGPHVCTLHVQRTFRDIARTQLSPYSTWAQVIKLSDAVQALPRSVTEFVHGVPAVYLKVMPHHNLYCRVCV